MAMSTRRARQLAAVLRDVLERSGMSRRAVAEKLGINHTKVVRWMVKDSDPTPPTSEDVAALLAVLEVTGDERDRIVKLARSDEADWLMSGPPGMNPQLATVMECERDATAITVWSPLVIPGLLQTADYARSVISRGSPTLSPHEVDSMVMVRNYRREALTRTIEPVTFHALIGLPAIHGGIGGHAVMADQLTHVLDMSKRDNVTVQVFDLSGEWFPAHAGPFSIYESATMPPTVYLEHHRSGAFLDDEDDVTAYQTAAEQIRREAMSPDQSAGLIADVITRSLETTG
jgi:transcriptional regulator with XRE-family HTH domain